MQFSFSLSFSHGKSPLLQILFDAETAANAAAVHLVSFKDAMENEFAVCNSRACINNHTTLG